MGAPLGAGRAGEPDLDPRGVVRTGVRAVGVREADPEPPDREEGTMPGVMRLPSTPEVDATGPVARDAEGAGELAEDEEDEVADEDAAVAVVDGAAGSVMILSADPWAAAS